MFSDGARTLRDHRIERGPGRVRQHCHAARDAARAPAPTRLEVRNSLVRVHRNSLVRVHLYRSRRGRPGPNAAARAVGPLQIGASTSGGQPEGCLAVRAPAGHASRTGVEGSAHRDHGALLPRQHSRCAGVRGAERTSKEQRSDQAEANQETSTEEPVGLLRNMPTRDIGRSAPPCESMRRLQTPHRASPERARSDVACRRGWGRSAWMC